MSKKKPYFTKEKLPVRAKTLKKNGKLADQAVDSLVTDCLLEIDMLTRKTEDLRKSLEELRSDPDVMAAIELRDQRNEMREMRLKIDALERKLDYNETYRDYDNYH